MTEQVPSSSSADGVDTEDGGPTVLDGRVAQPLDDEVIERGKRHLDRIREQLARYGRDPRYDDEPRPE